MEPHADVLRRFYSQIQEVIEYPTRVAAKLYEKGVVSKDLLRKVDDREDKSAAIMSSVNTAVRADPKKLWVLIAVLEEFAESDIVASKMRHELDLQGLGEKCIAYPFDSTRSNYLYIRFI